MAAGALRKSLDALYSATAALGGLFMVALLVTVLLSIAGRQAGFNVPGIDASDVVRGGAGVRAQALLSDGKLVDDFLIIRGHNALHVCNAPSPAATASLEIGKAIVEQIPAPAIKTTATLSL